MGETIDIEIPADRQAPAQARELVNSFTRHRLPDRQREQAKLLVSELASNAVIHGPAQDALHLGVALEGGCLHVEVTDGGRGFSPPDEPQPRQSEGGGFGLFLLSRAADRWGVRQNGRCRVWFELDVPPVAAAA